MLGMAINNVAMSLFMLGTALMLLRGRMTRIVLNDFRLGMFGIIDIRLIITTVKSNMFQLSLR